MSVCENYQDVEKKVTEACKRAGRAREEVTLIAVSKTKPLSMIEELLPLGVRDFGENKVQELTQKAETLVQKEVVKPQVRWHMIGHLQRNKVKYLVDKACMIHSVDSLRLAEEINKEAGKKGIRIPVLIEVNVAEEESKFGVPMEDAETDSSNCCTSMDFHSRIDDDCSLCGESGRKSSHFQKFKKFKC